MQYSCVAVQTMLRSLVGYRVGGWWSGRRQCWTSVKTADDKATKKSSAKNHATSIKWLNLTKELTVTLFSTLYNSERLSVLSFQPFIFLVSSAMWCPVFPVTLSLDSHHTFDAKNWTDVEVRMNSGKIQSDVCEPEAFLWCLMV